MIIEIHTKNCSLIRSVEVADGAHLPRVGEVIVSPEDADHLQGRDTLLVHEVEHTLQGGRLTAFVRCHSASDSDHRRLILEEQGWLQPRD